MNDYILTTSVYGATDTGCVRTNNEDNYIARYVWDNTFMLCAAIDGIGGYEGGEVAAEIARRTIEQHIEDFRDTHPLALIKQAVVEANNEIIRNKEARPQLSQMGCVATAALIDLENCVLYMAHVGDSRLYQYSDDRLLKLSHDHSMVGFREEIGDLTESEAMNHPQRNLIQRSLGETLHMADDPNFIDAAIYPFNASTQFLLCSDGLSDMLMTAEIASALSADRSPRSEVKQLIGMAKQAGGKDNITVVIARIDMKQHITADTHEPTDCISDENESNSTDRQDLSENVNAHTKSHRRLKLLLWLPLAIVLGVGLAFVLLRGFSPGTGHSDTYGLDSSTIVIPVTNELASDSASLLQSDSLTHPADTLRMRIQQIDAEIESLQSRRSILQHDLDSINTTIRNSKTTPPEA